MMARGFVASQVRGSFMPVFLDKGLNLPVHEIVDLGNPLNSGGKLL